MFQCVKVNAESGCHLLPDNMLIFDRMQKWLYDSKGIKAISSLIRCINSWILSGFVL